MQKEEKLGVTGTTKECCEGCNETDGFIACRVCACHKKKENNKEEWLCRYAPSLGPLEGTPEMVWNTEDYDVQSLIDDGQHLNLPTVFFGLYGLPDFFRLWRHQGRKAILWAGTDILHFINGYWLDDEGSIKLSPKPLATWINKNCESYVENEVERAALLEVGIESKVVPSFMGNVEDYKLTYVKQDSVRLYTSVSGDDFKRYGWDKVIDLAHANPSIEFHLYGNSKSFHSCKNVIEHGRVPKEQMNEEIKHMTGALRLTEFDGFSEIVAKSLLWGQYPVSIIPYPHTISPANIEMLKIVREPNIKGREWLLSVVNKYPWNERD